MTVSTKVPTTYYIIRAQISCYNFKSKHGFRSFDFTEIFFVKKSRQNEKSVHKHEELLGLQ